jgi:hypothetical protein
VKQLFSNCDIVKIFCQLSLGKDLFYGIKIGDNSTEHIVGFRTYGISIYQRFRDSLSSLILSLLACSYGKRPGVKTDRTSFPSKANVHGIRCVGLSRSSAIHKLR